MQGQLAQAEQHAAQYKTIADSVEQNLREQMEANEQFRQTLEARVTETVQGTHWRHCGKLVHICHFCDS